MGPIPTLKKLKTGAPAAQPVPMRSRVIRRPLSERDPLGNTWAGLNMTQKTVLLVHGVILMAVAYHGYKRNRNSVPWGAAWSVSGLVCPTVTMGFALTQGFAKRSSKTEE